MANDYRFAAVSLTPDVWADKMAGSNAELFPGKKGHRIRDAGVPSHEHTGVEGNAVSRHFRAPHKRVSSTSTDLPLDDGVWTQGRRA
jgi:hypothetical protein